LEDKFSKKSLEDTRFNYSYMIKNYASKCAFLKSANYYYRKNIISTTYKALIDEEVHYATYYGILGMIEETYLNLNRITINIQNISLYFCIWFIKDIFKGTAPIISEKQEYLKLLDRIFFYIDTDTIMDFNLAGCW
ncbi:TPA: hypothetical protein RZH57_001801, partial [Campylobacter coli]|nr:hypothetical protein [Campylobacter coli]